MAFFELLEERIKDFSEILDLIENVLNETLASYTASRIIQLLAEYRPQRLKALIPRLLEEDPTFIKVYSVQNYVNKHYQNLLTPFLSKNTYKGRFSEGERSITLSIDNGFHRWTVTQQEIFAQVRIRNLTEPERPVGGLPDDIEKLAGLCFVDASHIIAFTRDERHAVRAAALRSLAKLDGGQGIPTIREALDDERAPDIIHSLRGCLDRMSKLEALKLLQSVPTTKVTVAKGIIRSMGDL